MCADIFGRPMDCADMPHASMLEMCIRDSHAPHMAKQITEKEEIMRLLA